MSLPDNFKPVPGTPIVMVAPNDWCLVPVAAAATGYTPKAIERKRQEGVWVEGVHWRRAPDGHIFVCLSAVSKWVASGGGKRRKAA